MNLIKNASNGFKVLVNTVKTADVTPKVLLVGGVGLIVTGTVGTVIQSIKGADDVCEMKDRVANIKDCKENGYYEAQDDDGETYKEEYTDKMFRSDFFWALWECCKKLSKKLAVPAIMIFLGVYSVLKSNKMLDERLTEKTLSLMAVERMYNQYRKNVRDDLGEEADSKYRFGTRTEKDVIVEEYDETKETMVPRKQKKAEVTDELMSDAASDFAFIFESTNACTGNVILDDSRVQSIINLAQMEYDEYGRFSLIELYRRFGYYPETDEQLGLACKAGWLKGYSDDKIRLTRKKALVGSETPFGERTLFDFNCSYDVADRLIALSKKERVARVGRKW